MKKLLRNFVDQKLGDILQVDEENMSLDWRHGVASLKQAPLRAEVFDDLHFPVTLKGGFVGELSVDSHIHMFQRSSVDLVVKNVSLLLGPRRAEWDWEAVRQSRTKLIDLLVRLIDLSQNEENSSFVAHEVAATRQGKWRRILEMCQAAQQKLVQNVVRKLARIIKVHIANIHIRYEDSSIVRGSCQFSRPLACGLKVGYIGVTSKPSSDQDSSDPNTDSDCSPLCDIAKKDGAEKIIVQEVEEFRTNGDWKHSKEQHADPMLSHCVVTRRISIYWDSDVDKNTLFAEGPVLAEELCRRMAQLNARELFSACVVDHILQLFPHDHPRRIALQGPCYRERYDYHKYIVFPLSLSAHLSVNSDCDATRRQRAPMLDAHILGAVEVAMDSEQIRGVNELVAHIQDFSVKTQLLIARPPQTIDEILNDIETPCSDSLPPTRQTRRNVVRSWWHYAYHGVQIMCGLKFTHCCPYALRKQKALRQEYMASCMEEFESTQQCGSEDDDVRSISTKSISTKTFFSSIRRESTMATTQLRTRLADLQMRLRIRQVLTYREQAKKAFLEKQAAKADGDSERIAPHLWAEDFHLIGAGAAFDLMSRKGLLARPHWTPHRASNPKLIASWRSKLFNFVENPTTTQVITRAQDKLVPTSSESKLEALQVCVHLTSFHASFLVVSRRFLEFAMKFAKLQKLLMLSRQMVLSRETLTHRMVLTRQLAVRGALSDLSLDIVQRGSSQRRVGQWIELSVASIDIYNCSFSPSSLHPLQVLTIKPCEERLGRPVCIFLGVNLLAVADASSGSLEGDVSFEAVSEPWLGVRTHLQAEFSGLDDPTGSLQPEQEATSGPRTLCFLFLRVGYISILGYRPVLYRLKHMAAVGRRKPPLRSKMNGPSPHRQLHIQLNQEVLAKIKAALPGQALLSADVVLDGSRIRVVERYNLRHVMCASTEFAPSHLCFDRDFGEQLDVKIYHLNGSELISSNGSDPSASAAANLPDADRGLRWSTRPRWSSRSAQSDASAGSTRPRWSSRDAESRALFLGEEGEPSAESDNGGRAVPVSLLPVRLSIELLSKSDFNKEFFWGMPGHSLTVSQLGTMEKINNGRKNEWRAQENRLRLQTARTKMRLLRLRLDEEKGVTDDIVKPTQFLKWGRNGRPKERWVFYDTISDAIVWSNQRNSRHLGSIPMVSVQDVVTGVQTPVLLHVRDHRLRPDLVFSIVSAERTLDLQAESHAYQQKWVAGLKAQFEKQFERVYSKREHSMEVPRCKKAYPPNYRCKSATLLRSEDLSL